MRGIAGGGERKGAGDPLRVLQIYPKDDFYTGAAIQLRDLARGLAARGHRVLVVTQPSARWAAEAEDAGFAHVGFFRSPADPVGALRLAALLRTEGTQVVHAHKGGGRTLTLLARAFGPRPPLVVNRGVSFPLSLGGRLLDRSRLVARVVAVCEAIKAGLILQGVPADKIEVVYSGTDTDHFDPARARGTAIRAELGLDPATPLVTQIGVREPKGNDDVIRAFARVRAARSAARLLLVGARTAKRGPLAALTAELGLEPAVTIWGYRDDIPEILAASDVSVDASHVGHGITGALRESLAMETPVVATAAAGNPELVLHERTGLLVRPRDPEALGAAILRLLEAPAWAEALGRAGRTWVRERFSTAAKVERLEALYRRLTSRN
ncbi:MAG TPA: glycosyltransferase family 4 protein [Methylomirabilota bacterium]|nr:glycosyltransferase family 4 protein [Methylomirabilota bacterium]